MYYYHCLVLSKRFRHFLVGSSLSVMAIKVKQQFAYGSSCSTGGVFQGRAEGNAINIGGAVEVREGMDVFREGPVQKPVKGKIHFYISNLNPPDIDITKSSFIANVSNISKCEIIQDVIGCGS